MRLRDNMAALALATGVAALGTAASADPVWDRIEASGKIVCGAIPNDRIGSWEDRGTGQWEGYEIELCRAIAADLSEEMGKEITPEFQITSWGTIVLDVQSGKIDIWPGMSATEERKKALSMVGPIYELAFCGVRSRTFTGGETWESLNDPSVRIATVTGTSVETAFKQNAPNATHIGLAEFAEVALAVQSGRADIMGADILRCMALHDTARNTIGDILVPEPVVSLGSSAGVAKEAERLTEWLTAWAEEERASGGITEIFMHTLAVAGMDTSALPDGLSF